MKTSIIHPATFMLDGGAMFGIIPRPLWSKKITPDEQNRIHMSLRVMLIETKNRKILVDTGIGDYHPEKFCQQFNIKTQDSPLLTILKEQKNIEADQITDIIITHLHFDHVGGLGHEDNDGKMQTIFKNATIHVHKDHYAYSLKPTLRDSGSFQKHYFAPLLEEYKNEGRLNLVNGMDGCLIQDGDEKVEFKTSFGHTPYMIHPIANGLIYMADLVPMAHHIHIPWVMGYDIEPGVTTEYKQSFYEYIHSQDLKMIFEHDDEHWGAKLEVNDKGRFIASEFYKSENSPLQEIH